MRVSREHLATRRQVVAGLAVSGLGVSGLGVPFPGLSGLAAQTLQREAQIDLWPQGAPGAPPTLPQEREVPRFAGGPPGDTAFVHVARPGLLRCRPTDVGAVANGASILLIPGGGYVRVAVGHGGRALLRGFAAHGYTTFLLKYRLPGDGWQAGPDAPLDDAARALQIVREEAERGGLDPARVGLWGGSAGGHLACRLAATDAVKAAALLYPVNLMSGPHAHLGSVAALSSGMPAGRAIDEYSAEAAIHWPMPPVFLHHALDDRVVPVENSLSLFARLRAHDVAAELHVIERGGHGFGWQMADGTPAAWPAQAMAFMQRHGV